VADPDSSFGGPRGAEVERRKRRGGWDVGRGCPPGGTHDDIIATVNVSSRSLKTSTTTTCFKVQTPPLHIDHSM